MDVMEEKFVNLEEAMKDLVAKMVDKAVEAMRQSLTEVLMEGQTMVTKKFGTEFDSMAARLEGRINRSREYHESLINTMRNEQLQFQSEMGSVLMGNKISMGEKLEGSNSQVISQAHSTPIGPGSQSHGMPNLGFGGGGRMTGSGSVIGGGSGGGPGNWRYRKLDIPIFDGTDPDGWVLRVERYFTFYHLTVEEMLEVAAVAMDGMPYGDISGKINGIPLGDGQI